MSGSQGSASRVGWLAAVALASLDGLPADAAQTPLEASPLSATAGEPPAAPGALPAGVRILPTRGVAAETAALLMSGQQGGSLELDVWVYPLPNETAVASPALPATAGADQPPDGGATATESAPPGEVSASSSHLGVVVTLGRPQPLGSETSSRSLTATVEVAAYGWAGGALVAARGLTMAVDRRRLAADPDAQPTTTGSLRVLLALPDSGTTPLDQVAVLVRYLGGDELAIRRFAVPRAAAAELVELAAADHGLEVIDPQAPPALRQSLSGRGRPGGVTLAAAAPGAAVEGGSRPTTGPGTGSGELSAARRLDRGARRAVADELRTVLVSSSDPAVAGVALARWQALLVSGDATRPPRLTVDQLAEIERELVAGLDGTSSTKARNSARDPAVMSAWVAALLTARDAHLAAGRFWLVGHSERLAREALELLAGSPGATAATGAAVATPGNATTAAVNPLQAGPVERRQRLAAEGFLALAGRLVDGAALASADATARRAGELDPGAAGPPLVLSLTAQLRGEAREAARALANFESRLERGREPEVWSEALLRRGVARAKLDDRSAAEADLLAAANDPAAPPWVALVALEERLRLAIRVAEAEQGSNRGNAIGQARSRLGEALARFPAAASLRLLAVRLGLLSGEAPERWLPVTVPGTGARTDRGLSLVLEGLDAAGDPLALAAPVSPAELPTEARSGQSPQASASPRRKFGQVPAAVASAASRFGAVAAAGWPALRAEICREGGVECR